MSLDVAPNAVNHCDVILKKRLGIMNILFVKNAIMQLIAVGNLNWLRLGLCMILVLRFGVSKMRRATLGEAGERGIKMSGILSRQHNRFTV